MANIYVMLSFAKDSPKFSWKGDHNKTGYEAKGDCKDKLLYH